jgi:serine/threonine protein kinase/Tol biopolymer transport system component
MSVRASRMKPERRKQIEKLYDAALQLEVSRRAAFLDQACAGDEELGREVASLLASDAQAANLLPAPAAEIASSAIGRRIGHYQVLSLLGAGGMGEVYLAEDTQLGRKLALKLLPTQLTADADRLRRFEREARAASALNHPNIITIFEIGQEGSTHYIATEFIDGETLRQQIADAPGQRMKPSEAVGTAAQIAAALAAAHEAGIIHRDIKPENVMVRRDGLVKVLDFGLAKLTEPAPSVNYSQASTLARNSTEAGVVIGTPRYMSPEQARGEKVDARTDIFSLGVMLYEMLSGQPAFRGASAVEVMNAILKEEPPELSETKAKISPQLEKIVRRCLEKKPEMRFHSAHDLGFALDALTTPSGSRLETQPAAPVVTERAGPSRLFGQARLAWAVAAALSLLAVGLIWAHFARQPTADARVMKSSILPPEKSSFGQIAVSPDGRHLAFTAATGGKVQLWVRALEATEARALPGTQGAIFPFWSPDSRFIGFFTDNRLKKIEVSGGLAQTLCDAPEGRGGAWSRDGVILFAPQGGSVLFRISAGGGEVTQVTTKDQEGQENSHLLPAFLPDGRHFLYSIRSGQKETRGIYLGSLDETVKRRLLGDFGAIRYMAAVTGATAGGGDGWLLFGRDGALLAQPFDARRHQFTGEPFLISEKVGSDPVFFTSLTPSFSASDNGVLVFDPSANRQGRQYVWMDRRGQHISSFEVTAGLGQHWLSPDEKRFIADRFDPQAGTGDLWLCDVAGGNSARFTFDPAPDFNPVWAPDGRRIIWSSARNSGVLNLYQKAASLAGEDTLLLKSDQNKFATDWSRDGRFIIYRQNDPKTKSDVWVLPVGNGETQPFPVLRTEANEAAGSLSPDGRWLAYASDESGLYEVYVQSFPKGGGKRQVSTGGGNHPRWRRDGRELFYYAPDGKLMAAPVERAESFEVGAVIALFEFRAGNVLTSTRAPYAVTADGQRFLINAAVETEPNAPLTVVVNWAAGVKR